MTADDLFHIGMLVVGVVLLIATAWFWPEDRG